MTLAELYNLDRASSHPYIDTVLPIAEARVLHAVVKFHNECLTNDLVYTVDGIVWSALKMEKLLIETKLNKATFSKARDGLFDKFLLIKACVMIPSKTMLKKITLYHPNTKEILKIAEEGKRIQDSLRKAGGLNYPKFYGEITKLFDTVNLDRFKAENNEGPDFRPIEGLRNDPLKDKSNLDYSSSSESLRDSSEEVCDQEVAFCDDGQSSTANSKKRILKKSNKTTSVEKEESTPVPAKKKKLLKKSNKTTKQSVSETSTQLRSDDETETEGDEESISLPSKGPQSVRGRRSSIDETETILKSIPAKKSVDRSKFKGAGPRRSTAFHNIEVSPNVQRFIDTWNDYAEGDESVHRIEEFHKKGPNKGLEQTKKFQSVVKALKKLINGTLWKDVGKISLDEFERMIERLLDCAYDSEVFPKNKEWLQRNLHLDFALLGIMGTVQPLFLQHGLENPQIILRHVPKNEDLADDMREQYAKLILGFKKKKWSAKEINKLNKASNDLIRFVNEHKRVLDMRYTLFDYLDWLFEAVVWYYRTKMKADITVGHMCSPYTWETVFPRYLTEQKIMDSGL